MSRWGSVPTGFAGCIRGLLEGRLRSVPPANGISARRDELVGNGQTGYGPHVPAVHQSQLAGAKSYNRRENTDADDCVR